MPAPSFPTYVDGYYGTPLRISRTPREYPFAHLGDLTTAIYSATYVVDQGRFTPTVRGTEDPENAGFYLIAESKPEIFQGDLATFTRTYSRIPLLQVELDSMFVTKPSLSGTFPAVIGGATVLQPDPSVAIFKFYSRKAVTSENGAPSADNPTGGTYTVTVGANTTAAIAYNASAATLAAALNGLASVSDRGSISAAGVYSASFSLKFAAYAAGSITSSLTVGAAAITVTTFNETQMLFRIIGLPEPLGAAIIGGTFTVTIFGQTTGAIAYNASFATLASAITGLSKVGATGTTVVQPGANGYTSSSILRSDAREILFLVTMTKPALSANGSSLTPGGSSVVVTPEFAVTADYTLQFTGVAAPTRIAYSAAHGITAADELLVIQGGAPVIVPAGKFSATADTITFDSTSGPVFESVGLIGFVGKLTSVYTGGTVKTRIKRITEFYLPGVSPGITTIDDVPLPPFQGDADSLLAAILAGDTSINYEVGDWDNWRDSPILSRTITTLDATKL